MEITLKNIHLLCFSQVISYKTIIGRVVGGGGGGGGGGGEGEAPEVLCTKKHTFIEIYINMTMLQLLIRQIGGPCHSYS